MFASLGRNTVMIVSLTRHIGSTNLNCVSKKDADFSPHSSARDWAPWKHKILI